TPQAASIAVADFNRDGKPDVVVADRNVNNLTVLLGDGNGALAPASGSPIAVGNDPESVTTGDFNHDGKADIAAANFGSGNITILLGNGSGGFSSAAGSPFAAGTQPYSITVGDFNLDGQTDLVVTNVSGSNVTVLTGDGNGGFSKPAGSPVVGTHQSNTVTAADFNLDGKPDLAVVNGDVGGVTIDLNGCSAPAPTPTPTPTPAPNLVLLNPANYAKAEACTSVTINVDRTGDTSGAATVDYATADGTATERGDYITARGTLSFGPGDTTKTITVLINDDSFVEGPETFFVNLSNPSGFNLGVPATAVITINPNLSEPPTNVIDDAQDFVCQHYHDFLGRQPDQSGWDFWTNQITSCGADAACTQLKQINVSAAFFLSIEFQKTGFYVERINKAAYGDATGNSTMGNSHQLPVPLVRYNEFVSDSQRMARGVIVLQPGWEQVLETNTQTFTAEFAQRSTFTAAFPASMTAAQFVDKLNANAGNPLSQSERDQLVTDLATNAKTRAQVLRAVAEDPDLVNAEFSRAFVLTEYFGYLRRNPNDPQDTDYSGYDFWLTKLNQFNGNYLNAQMTLAFLSSLEYRHRFGP
ncbi:MAG TPA: FG-GAP-like repeat-containing protein, partial [Pyrinomonadaceae bacterium]|nr:FG-GAP-like repeat-containing protein [Pyrinomonadaceae bacterium]